MLDEPGLLSSHQMVYPHTRIPSDDLILSYSSHSHTLTLSHSHTLVQGLNSPATLCLGVAQHVAGRVETFLQQNVLDIVQPNIKSFGNVF